MVRNSWLGACLRGGAATVLVLSVGAGPASASEATRITQGQAIVEKNCARCHAVGRDGPSPLEKAPPFRTLASKYPIENLAEALAEGIVTGHPDMPQFAFEPNEIDAILAYLSSLDAKR